MYAVLDEERNASLPDCSHFAVMSRARIKNPLRKRAVRGFDSTRVCGVSCSYTMAGKVDDTSKNLFHCRSEGNIYLVIGNICFLELAYMLSTSF